MADPRQRNNSETGAAWFVRRITEIGGGGVKTTFFASDTRSLGGTVLELVESKDRKFGKSELISNGLRLSLGADSSKLKPWQILRTIGKAVVGLLAYEPIEFSVMVPDGTDPTFITMAVQGALLRCDDHKTDVTYLAPGRVEIVSDQVDTVGAALDRARASNVARWLACAPPTHLTIDAYMELLRDTLGKAANEVVEPTVEERARMGLLNAVAQANGGNGHVIAMVFHPQSGPTETRKVYVGKTIIFDQGGVCSKLKHSLGMKGDNGGGDALFGYGWYLAQHPEILKETTVLVWAVTDNLVDARASIPDGIYTAYNGQTVEMINTDAEGRLVSADAAMWAEDRFKLGKGDSLCFVCTLTGAVIYALGNRLTGLHIRGSHDKLGLVGQLEQIGFASGDPVNILHNLGEADELLKSDVADVANSNRGKPNAGSSQGFAFMSFFMGDDLEVLELDIAGTSGDFSDSIYQKGTANPAGVWWMIAREERPLAA